MKKLILTLSILAAPLAAKAADLAAYQNARANFQATIDSCDLIHARDILELGTLSIAELEMEEETLNPLFNLTIKKRQRCYRQTKDMLDDVIALGAVYLNNHPEDTHFARQHELDLSLREMLGIRQKLSKQLLNSMLLDLQKGLKRHADKPADQKAEIYPDESEKTRALIKEDMDMVLAAERRQINLNEVELIGRVPTVEELTALKLKKAHHYFSRALMAFEDIYMQKRLFAIARLHSDFSYGNAQFAELFAFSKNLEGLPDRRLAATIAHTADRALVLALDIEGALRDLRSGEFTEDYDTWVTELYQDMSTLAIDIQELIKHLNAPKPEKPQEEAPELAELEAAFDAIINAKLPEGEQIQVNLAPVKPAYEEMPVRLLDPTYAMRTAAKAEEE